MKVAAVIRGCKQAISVIEVTECGRIYIEKGCSYILLGFPWRCKKLLLQKNTYSSNGGTCAKIL